MMEYSLEEGIKKIRMPLLVASVNGIELTFLIDTGASNNVIASFVYDQLQEGFVLLGKQFKMMGVEGNYNTVATVETFLSFRNLNIKTTCKKRSISTHPKRGYPFTFLTRSS